MLQRQEDLFKFIRRTMFCANMYSPHLEGQLPFQLLGIVMEMLYEIFLYFVTIHIAVLYVCTFYLNIHNGDLELLVNCLMQTIIYLWTILMKFYFRHWQKKRLENLIDFINLNYKTRSAIGKYVLKYSDPLSCEAVLKWASSVSGCIFSLYADLTTAYGWMYIISLFALHIIKGFTYVTVDDSFAMSNKWIKLYVYCCFTCAICWLMVPIAYGDRSLPLACWYPFDYKQPIIYEIIYFLQCVAQIQVAASFSSSSGFHMVLSILISGQYDILYCSLKNILATVAINRNATKRDLRKLKEIQEFGSPEVNEYYCSKEISCHINTLMTRSPASKEYQDFHHQLRNAFKECVDHHYFIVECLKKMEDFYSPIWFLKTGEVMLLMCLVAFVSVKTTAANSSFMKMISLAQYLLMVALEFLVICYFGEIIYINSQRCAEAILRSPWYVHIPEIKHDFLIFLLNTKKPFALTAGKIYALNVECFKGIMTTAFSFLTFLQNMDERSE